MRKSRVPFTAIIPLLDHFGFPVVVATYLLWRIDPVLRSIQAAQAAQLELMGVLTRRMLRGNAQHSSRRR